MSSSQHETVTTAERGREFWRGTLLAGAFTALPRWTREPVAGVGEHDARIPDELVAALRRLANELAVPLSEPSEFCVNDAVAVVPYLPL